MMKNANPLPINVVAALVARFNPNLTQLHFSGNDVSFHINDYNLTSDGAWRVQMTHVSGQNFIATLTPDLSADFGWSIKYSVLYDGMWYPQD